jgi:hypothetical protein
VPWAPPEQLTESSLLELDNEPRIRLSTAVNVMAFGKPEPPKGMDTTELTARHVQAAIALFDGPAKRGVVSLVGSPDVEGGDRSEIIPAEYFDMPRCLSDADNSIYTNLARLAESCEGPNPDWDAARKGQHQRWFNVRVETQAFIVWVEDCVKPTVFETLWLADPRAVAWALTRDKSFSDRCLRCPGKSFVGDDIVFADDEHDGHLPELYFDGGAEEAWSHLRDAIEAGKVRIDPPDWQIDGTTDWRNSAARLFCKDLLAAFPAGRPLLPAAQPLTVKAETDCQVWLVSLMTESRQCRPKKKSTYFEVAQKRFPGLSERAFERAWANAIKETGSNWGKAGAPKKSPQ